MRRNVSDKTSWVVAITSICYGMTVIARSLMYHEALLESSSSYAWLLIQNYATSIFLIIFGVMKVVFVYRNQALLRKIAIVGLMSIWSFIETDYILAFILEEPNREAILIAPIIVLCLFIAGRSEPD